jgi:ArsR family metal-binding transcriptional regulator
MSVLTTFPRIAEFEKACRVADELRISYTVISPATGYTSVGTPAIVMEEADRGKFVGQDTLRFVTLGWVDYFPASISVPASQPPVFEDDRFGSVSVMVLQPCIADSKKLRAIMHLSGDLTEVFPYMNSVRRDAFYNINGPTFTFMEQYRMITLYPRRIAVAKVDDIIDLWRILESLRIGFNECWRDRAAITPSNELRKKPAALEIYLRLPKTNCGECGEKACMAFALKLWSGQVSLSNCKPAFEGTHTHLKEALFEICAGLGIEKGGAL